MSDPSVGSPFYPISSRPISPSPALPTYFTNSQVPRLSHVYDLSVCRIYAHDARPTSLLPLRCPSSRSPPIHSSSSLAYARHFPLVFSSILYRLSGSSAPLPYPLAPSHPRPSHLISFPSHLSHVLHVQDLHLHPTSSTPVALQPMHASPSITSCTRG
ncbi:hypothetical protein BDN70DRAFT_701518 [Pholiota conissans]|uniref:Uncharacterized protein n=1 Tax=Pholiota conissans TaxID=109636 RepID=A0A9P5Z2S7_9AGAR|nr:hypothetical protein BDN70DRAFT_701518 [Pholiota conissans]